MSEQTNDDAKTKGLPPGVVWRNGQFIDLKSGKTYDADLARDAAKLGKWNRAAVDDRRRQVWDMMSRGVPETVIAKLFTVHRNTIVNDVKAIREANREAAKRSDPFTEIGTIARRFEDLLKVSLENFQMARKPGEKASFLSNALKALMAKAEFLVKTGVIPAASLNVTGSLTLSGGLDVSRMTLEEMKAARNDLLKKLLSRGEMKGLLPTGTN